MQSAKCKVMNEKKIPLYFCILHFALCISFYPVMVALTVWLQGPVSPFLLIQRSM